MERSLYQKQLITVLAFKDPLLLYYTDIVENMITSYSDPKWFDFSLHLDICIELEISLPILFTVKLLLQGTS